MQIRAQKEPWDNGVCLLVKDGSAYGTAITMEQHREGEYVKPTIRINNTAAQVLMDDLWNAGIRPTEGSGSAGAMRAVERHLGDMRKIAANKLDIEL